MQEKNLLDAIQKKIESWLKEPFDQATQDEIRHLQKTNPEKLYECFYTDLSFGTAGLRGIMGVGTNRVNSYTIQMATQGLANYINKVKTEASSVVIGYDNRNNSKTFAEDAAKVLAANGIKVYLTKDLRPTPFVSFACLYKKASAAIMITASHNPPEYNGYKVYWSHGAQITPPEDEGIIKEVKNIKTYIEVKTTTLDHPLITYLGHEDDIAYLKKIEPLQNYPEINKKEGKNLSILYSSLHGTGLTLVPSALYTFGFTNVSFVEEQKEFDPLFTSVKSPNPEDLEALSLGIKKLEEEQHDLFLATDPDADRIGVVCLHENKPKVLNGNQIAAICTYYLLTTRKKRKILSLHSAVISTIVTTRLLKKICTSFKIPYFETLTGFKYIGKKMHEFESNPGGMEFLFGAEESYGYLYGSQGKDKDAIITACLLSEIALQQKLKHKTLYDLLLEIYKKYGFFYEKQKSFSFGTDESALKKMQKIFSFLRKHPPISIQNVSITSVDDYVSSIHLDLKTKKETPIFLPKSDVFTLYLTDGSIFVIRPSGTEPKIKIYGMLCNKKYHQNEDLSHFEKELERKLVEIQKILLSYEA